MSDPLQFASLTLDDGDDIDLSNRGVIADETEETATFASAASATNNDIDGADDVDEPLAAPPPVAPPTSSSFPDEPPPPYESIVMGTASAMVRLFGRMRAGKRKKKTKKNECIRKKNDGDKGKKPHLNLFSSSSLLPRAFPLPCPVANPR